MILRGLAESAREAEIDLEQRAELGEPRRIRQLSGCLTEPTDDPAEPLPQRWPAASRAQIPARLLGERREQGDQELRQPGLGGLSDALASTYTTWNAAPSFGTRSVLASRSSSVDLPQPEWPVTSSRR